MTEHSTQDTLDAVAIGLCAEFKSRLVLVMSVNKTAQAGVDVAIHAPSRPSPALLALLANSLRALAASIEGGDLDAEEQAYD